MDRKGPRQEYKEKHKGKEMRGQYRKKRKEIGWENTEGKHL